MNECPIDESGSNEKCFEKSKFFLISILSKRNRLMMTWWLSWWPWLHQKAVFYLLSFYVAYEEFHLQPCQRQFIKIRYYDIKSKIKVLTSEQTLYYQLLYKFCFSGSIVQNKHCINSSFINCAFQVSQFRISIVLKSVRKLISCSGTTLLANIWRESSTVFMTNPL